MIDGSLGSRRDFLKSFTAVAGLSILAVGAPVQAVRDYSGIKYLGGGDLVDLNNANIRVYARMPGMYPNIASKIVAHGPYQQVSEIYNIPGLTLKEKQIISQHEKKFVVREERPEYAVDKINNGLYR
eukprot:CAMPEP_0113945762 /NCGR_PEP_ID=MMETSP1339-20121228/51144_1 /TAXON_ID=94617 /ORGANISM="Fibrocapsa japonica" /LENGTH=126 /DNA_ID=CAMNT_0000951519 /DNA_START=199 /DNA_END=579 /DNA_ORIENTATION=+ /assembly_acc=CAM_ASM_000762